jgi:hypothetical protein
MRKFHTLHLDYMSGLQLDENHQQVPGRSTVVDSDNSPYKDIHSSTNGPLVDLLATVSLVSQMVAGQGLLVVFAWKKESNLKYLLILGWYLLGLKAIALLPDKLQDSWQHKSLHVLLLLLSYL